MPAARPLVGIFLFLGSVRVVAEHLFRQRNVDPSFVFLPQLAPTPPPRVRRTLLIIWIKLWLVLFEHFWVARPVRSRKHPIFRPPQLVRFQTQFELRDFARLPVAEQPIVGVSPVVSVEHDLRVFVDRTCILQRFPRSREFWLAIGIPPFKLRNGCFRYH